MKVANKNSVSQGTLNKGTISAFLKTRAPVECYVRIRSGRASLQDRIDAAGKGRLSKVLLQPLADSHQ